MKHKHLHEDCHECKKRVQSVFCSLKPDEVDELNEQKFCSLYKKGQEIFQEGTKPHYLHIVNQGKVKLVINIEGKEQIVRLAQDGDTIGYRALLCKDLYSATAITMEDSKICSIPMEFFFKIIEQNVKVASAYTTLLAKELKEAQMRLAEIAIKPVRERVAETLLILKQTFGLADDGKTINISLSREEIAQIAGTATETTIRLLSEFRKDNIIDFDKKKIIILNPRKLLVEANVWD